MKFMSKHAHTIQAGGYGETLGIRLLREMAERGLFIFSTDEAKVAGGEIGIDEGYCPQLLAHLVAGGWLRRLRRGLYAGLGRLPGSVEVHPFAVATRLVSPAAISHWSALHHHGLTEQVPRHVTASTPRKVVTPSMRTPSKVQRREGQQTGEEGGKHLWQTNGVAYEYFTVTRDRFFGIEEVWVDEHFRVPIYDKERSLLDGFVAPRVFGSLSEPLGILEEHLGALDRTPVGLAGLHHKGRAAVLQRHAHRAGGHVHGPLVGGDGGAQVDVQCVAGRCARQHQVEAACGQVQPRHRGVARAP